MKIHTTNYSNTLIEVAEDCPVFAAASPPQKPIKTVAEIQFEMISQNPYQYTSDNVIFECFAVKNNLSENEKKETRNLFFSKGQPCMRTSPLAKRYGFGIHHNAESKIALVPMESEDYQKFVKDENIKKVKAMKSKK